MTWINYIDSVSHGRNPYIFVVFASAAAGRSDFGGRAQRSDNKLNNKEELTCRPLQISRKQKRRTILKIWKMRGRPYGSIFSPAAFLPRVVSKSWWNRTGLPALHPTPRYLRKRSAVAPI